MENSTLQERQKKQKITNIKQSNNHVQFSSLIIDMMKKIRKNSPLFKPIKKLKTSIQAIGGQDQVSFYQPTNTLIVFHFGLGNQLDRQIILNGTNLSQIQREKKQLRREFIILPGKAFSFIQFCQIDGAKQFVRVNELRNIFEQIEEEKSEVKKKDNMILEEEQKQQKQQPKEQNTTQQPNKQTPLFYYKQLTHKNLTRLTIFFYLNTSHSHQQPTQTQNPLTNLPTCPSIYTPNSIPGLHLIQQIITPQEQLNLLQWLDSQQWQKLSNRRVQHYGYEFKYGRNQIDKDEKYQHSMPQVFDFLLKRLKKIVWQLSHQQIEYDQLTINDYFSGHGIPAHFDTHSPFEQYFVAVSMLSGIVMDWKKYDGTQKSTYLKQRSVVIFSGQARYAWLHSIACRKLDNVDGQLKHRSRRISLTFRKIRRSPCLCKYYFYCDSQGYDQNTMKKNNPLLTKYLCKENEQKLNKLSRQAIYKEYVLKAYSSFGYDFHNKIIPEMKQYLTKESTLLNQSQESKLILDIGCGNGQYKKHITSQNFFYIGIERCQKMLPVEEQVHMDGLRLAFREGLFDVVLLVAVLHHFTTQKDRLQCLRESKRMMRDDGVMYVTVFNYSEEKQQLYPSQDILLDYCLPTHKTIEKSNYQTTIIKEEKKHQHQLTSNEKQQGIKSQKGEIFSRYYHLFMKEQFQDLVNKSGLVIEETKMSKQNIIAKLRKHIDTDE